MAMHVANCFSSPFGKKCIKEMAAKVKNIKPEAKALLDFMSGDAMQDDMKWQQALLY